MKLRLTFVLLFVSLILSAQKSEIGVNLNSGLFYLGKDARKETTINWNNDRGYTNSPWGSVPALGYGVSVDMRYISPSGFLAGADIGVERARSKIKITGIWDGEQINATGKTILSTDAINLFPYIGKRFSVNSLAFDLTGGLDVSGILAIKEKGTAKDESGRKYTTSVDRKTIDWDGRARIQAGVRGNKMGVYIGYSYGFNDYKSGYDRSNETVSARYLRLGVTYLIKK